MAARPKRAASVRKPIAGSNGMLPPARLSAAEQALWDAHIKDAPALKPEDTMMAFTWVRLSAAYAANPDGTSINAQRFLNQLGSRLGFSPTQRKQLGARALRPLPVQPEKKKRFRFDYFGDGTNGPARRTNGNLI